MASKYERITDLYLQTAGEVATPEVTIRVSPAASEMVQFREIDGRRYILIDAAEGVEVNGVPVQLSGLQSD